MEELGFSKEGCSIYFSLLEKPSGETIEQILAHSSISSREAEKAVKELVEKGIVMVSSNKLEASETKQFVDRIQDMKRTEMSRDLDNLNAKSTRLLSLLEPQYWELRLGVKLIDFLDRSSCFWRWRISTSKLRLIAI